jgi:hypothetical protein
MPAAPPGRGFVHCGAVPLAIGALAICDVAAAPTIKQAASVASQQARRARSPLPRKMPRFAGIERIGAAFSDHDPRRLGFPTVWSRCEFGVLSAAS